MDTNLKLSHAHELDELLKLDPIAFRAALACVYRDAPEVFDAYVERFRQELATTNQREDLKSGVRRPRAAYLRRHSSISALVRCVPKGT